mmetsp:Transcript_34791/g.48442  ORF Transcript_34791/g.48442 Transcript_34791/m.48442 type:complete len:259 (+) Transcript_34791:54-830(+)
MGRKSLVGDQKVKNSLFQLQECNLSVFLNPSRLGDITKGIEEKLNEMLLQYSPLLEGVVLSYSHLKIKSDTGKIMHNFPHIECRVLVRFLIYAPRVGSCLKAKVNKIGPDFIGFLAEGIFNVSVSGDGLEGWKFKGGAWEFSNDDSSLSNGASSDIKRLEVGSEAHVIVKDIRTEEKGLFLLGRLLKNNNRPSTSKATTSTAVKVEKDDSGGAAMNRVKKEKKHSTKKRKVGTASGAATVASSKKKKKKQKKKVKKER